ncbi:hypothetical protein DMENIID0001_095510 [Sergentomyia squamirostris]
MMFKSVVNLFLIFLVILLPLISALPAKSNEILGKSSLNVEHRRPHGVSSNSISDHEKNQHVEYHKNRWREERKSETRSGRSKRQFEFMLSAEHEEQVGTDVAAEVNSLLWQTEDGLTRLDGSASYNRHFGVQGTPTDQDFSVKLKLWFL